MNYETNHFILMTLACVYTVLIAASIYCCHKRKKIGDVFYPKSRKVVRDPFYTKFPHVSDFGTAAPEFPADRIEKGVSSDSIVKREKPTDVHDNGKGMFDTQSGITIDLLYPTVEMISTDDIASALCNIGRFGGHATGDSVGLHSILVAALCPSRLKLEGLMHDSPEYCLGDVIKPLKNILGKVYTDLEDRFMKVISEKYKLDQNKLKEIKQYDKIALEMEHKAFQLKDKEAFFQIHSLIEKEVGGKFYPYQLPEIFKAQLNKYIHERNMAALA